MRDNPIAFIPESSILPIFIYSPTETRQKLNFKGTGFVTNRLIFITCWHCVKHPLTSDQRYVAVIKNGEGEGWKAIDLINLEQDANGNDIATANIEIVPEITPRLSIAADNMLMGTDVCTYGYPHIDVRKQESGEIQYILNGRYLKGYIMRGFFCEHLEHREVKSYELSFPAPEGLSGSPLIRVGSGDVVGIIYGNIDVATIEHTAIFDPETGNREPEIQRIISFGLAHYTDTLRNARGKATQGKTIAEYHAQ